MCAVVVGCVCEYDNITQCAPDGCQCSTTAFANTPLSHAADSVPPYQTHHRPKDIRHPRWFHSNSWRYSMQPNTTTLFPPLSPPPSPPQTHLMVHEAVLLDNTIDVTSSHTVTNLQQHRIFIPTWASTCVMPGSDSCSPGYMQVRCTSTGTQIDWHTAQYSTRSWIHHQRVLLSCCPRRAALLLCAHVVSPMTQAASCTF